MKKRSEQNCGAHSETHIDILGCMKRHRQLLRQEQKQMIMPGKYYSPHYKTDMNKVKAEILIPTVQYGNIRIFIEDTPENIIEESKRLNRIYQGGFGLDQKEWNRALDRYLVEGSIEPSTHEQMDERQQWMIHEIDKSISRQNYKNPKGELHHSVN